MACVADYFEVSEGEGIKNESVLASGTSSVESLEMFGG